MPRAGGPAGRGGRAPGTGREGGEVGRPAARALATLRGEAAVDVMRPYLDHHDPNLVVTAAAAPAGSGGESDADKAYEKLKHLAGEAGDSSAELRRRVARALGLV